MERRLTKSHPDWEALNKTANDLAVATNPQAHFWGLDESGNPVVIDEVERKAIVEKIKEKMENQLEGGRFADWINASPIFQ